jgi:hypothetical protein
MWFRSAGDEDSEPKVFVAASGSYRAQYFSLNIVPITLIQPVDEEG